MATLSSLFDRSVGIGLVLLALGFANFAWDSAWLFVPTALLGLIYMLLTFWVFATMQWRTGGLRIPALNEANYLIVGAGLGLQIFCILGSLITDIQGFAHAQLPFSIAVISTMSLVLAAKRQEQVEIQGRN
jgi:hypothetical protein